MNEEVRELIFESTRRRQLSRRLLFWFRRQARDLPWRQTRDPYAIWVSEIMLQQTQVSTVVPYFQRFLQAFPDIQALARADESQVLRLWEGLGYYRRVRHLHQAARVLVEQHCGVFPDDVKIVEGLPGIGRYTANAILSQAFERKLPILEANSVRLLSRLFARRDDPRRGPGKAWLWQAAGQLLPERQVGDFNQALMELGALVCTPEAPDCAGCPLAEDCLARQHGLQDVIPPRARKPATIAIDEIAIVPTRPRGQVLLVQRPAHGRWANLWEFPHGPVQTGESKQAAAHRLLAELTGLSADCAAPFLTLRYSVTHHRYTMACARGLVAGKTHFRSSFYQQARWLDLGQLADYPVSAPQRRLARALIEA